MPPSTATQLTDLLQLAAQVGELSDRLKKAEGELASQSAPIGAAKSSQDAALTALASAVDGIKALNFHVIDKNVGDLHARVNEVAEHLGKSVKELSARADAHAKELAEAKQETAQKLARTDAQRTELARKRDEDAKTLSESIALVANESAKRLAELSEQVQKFAERPGIRPSGAWGAGKTCDKGDLVSLNGSSYISLVDGNTEKPSKNSKKWQLIAARGGGGGSTSGGGIEEAPIDGTPYSRQDAGWVAAGAGAGDVVGPDGATDDNIATFDLATGKLIQDGGKTIAEVEASAVSTVATAPQTLTNKRITARIATLTDAATVTPATDSYDGGILATLSQTTDFLNPTGTPTDFQRYTLRIKSTSARALTWTNGGSGTQYRGSADLALPASTSGASLTDYLVFMYNAADDKWDLVGRTFGF